MQAVRVYITILLKFECHAIWGIQNLFVVVVDDALMKKSNELRGKDT